MMYVTVYINGRKIAHATAQNVSSLADISNYRCEAVEHESEFSPGVDCAFTIKDHPRRQSCWELVEKMAQEICARIPADVGQAQLSGGDNG